MLLLMPLFTALAIGLVDLLLSMLLSRFTQVRLLVHLPSIVAVFAGVYWLYIGYVLVRGFEGAAYGFLGVFTVMAALCVLLYVNRKMFKPTSEHD